MTMGMSVKLHPSWLEALGQEFDQPYMAELKRFLLAEREAGKRIFPAGSNWFRALDLTPLDKVRVVILGQDPYHGPDRPMGSAFGSGRRSSAAQPGQHLQGAGGRHRHPPGCHGFLEHWAKQGVLLLNSVLTVEMGFAASIATAAGKDSPTRSSSWSMPRSSPSCSCCGEATPRRRPRSSTAAGTWC
jgi:uracil-DNA glycosylase